MTEKKKLLIVAGAGATLPFGMPSSSTVGDWISDFSKQKFSLIHESGNFYDWIRDRVARHIEAHYPPPFGGINFEHVLGTIYQLIGTLPAGIFTNGLGSLVTLANLPDTVAWRTPGMLDRNRLIHFSDAINNFLVERFHEECKRERDVTPLREFLQTIRDEFNISVITTNYDNIIFDICPDLETGFAENGQFYPDRVLMDKDFEHFIHLHGSVYFYQKFPRTIFWDSSPDRKPPSPFGRASLSTPEGYVLPNSTIIAGYGKPYALMQIPFRTYYSKVDYLIESADALLILGFSFVDAHLSNAFTRFHQNRSRPVVSIDFAMDNKLTLGSEDRLQASETAERVRRLFGPHPSKMETFGNHLPRTVRELKEANEFEKSSDPKMRLAIWYGGMRTACYHADAVIRHLQP